MKTIFIICFSFLSICVTAQTNSLEKIHEWEGDIVSFRVDNLDNLYILNSRNQLKKYDNKGDSVAVYNQLKNYGPASTIDISNPLKILLYYKDFATITVLDRFLNAVNTIDLRKSQIFQAKAIATSFDNKIWVYDVMDGKLKKLNDDGAVLQETADFRQLFSEPISPQQIIDHNKLVYLYDSSQALYAFDYFGALKQKIPIKGWKNIKIDGRYLWATTDTGLVRYDVQLFTETHLTLPLPLANFQQIAYTTQNIYTLENNKLCIFRFNNNN